MQLRPADKAYLLAVFTYRTPTCVPCLVHHLVQDKRIISIYFNLPTTSSANSVYDFMLWLRQVRKELFPNCTYKVKRRKTPKSEHHFANISIHTLYHRY